MIDLDNPARGFVQIRAGFHTGPVLSNVVGSSQPRYSLFGDTVNTAARMESHSTAGRVQCSEAAASLLEMQGPEIHLGLRGVINVKGKGPMKTFWVIPPAISDDAQATQDVETASNASNKGVSVYA